MTSSELPPTLLKSSAVANAVALRRDPLEFFTRLAREAGDFAHYVLTDGVIYFVNEPQLIREVLIVQEGNFRKWATDDSFAAVFGSGLVGSNGELHRKMNRIARPAFQQDRFAGYARTIAELAEKRQASWMEGEIDLTREMALLTIEITGDLLFSNSLQHHAEMIFEASKTLLRLSSRLGGAPDDDRAFTDANNRITEVARELLREWTASAQGDDLLSYLMHGHSADCATVSEDQVCQEIRTFLLAGQVTTANTLSCAFWLLSQDRGSEERLRKELAAIIGTRKVKGEDVPRLRFCEAILLEVLRLYPPSWALSRATLCETMLGGYLLPAGARLVICPWVLHRDARYFHEPKRFDPSRWLVQDRSQLPRGVYLPFSMGSRGCIGERFAMMETALILACVAQKWSFRQLADARDPGWTPQLLYWPARGIKLNAGRRNSL